MTNEGSLIPADVASSLPSKYSDEAFDKSASSGNFTPRLQLLTSNSGPCKDGEFPANHYALVKDSKNQDLGKEVDVVVLSWRPKAMDMSGDSIITSHDPESDTYQQIQTKSETKDSGCMWGPEFLVWIPSAKSYATLFFGGKSSRRVAPEVKGLMHKGATLGSKKIETPQYSWFTNTCQACSSPGDLPAMDEIKEEINKFENPPESDVELAEDDKESSGSDRAV